MKTKLLVIILIFILGGFSTGFLAENTNAQTWSAVGVGVGNDINALSVYNGELYAGGWFSTAGGNPAVGIAKWDGVSWASVGTGLNGHVHALTVHDGELYVGGHFTAAGGNTAKYIAKWDGASWSAVGTGMNEHVYALASYNGELYAGGEFTMAGGNTANYIAKWDGTNWSEVDIGMNHHVWSLAVYNGELYAGGTFFTAGGNLVNGIAKWDGTNWSAVGTGIADAGGWCVVAALCVYNGELYVGGSFTTAGGISAKSIAKWDGINWSAVGTGVNNSGPPPPNVYALAVYNGDLYVGGLFTTAGGNPSSCIAQWNGATWSAVGAGVGGTVWGLAEYNGELYAGGFFTTAGGNPANYIAKWNSGTIGIEDVSTSLGTTSVFPNPSSGAFIVLNADSEIQNLIVTTIFGETIYKSELRSKKLEINLSDQPKGIYFIQGTLSSGENAGKITTQKIIIQ